MHYLSQTAVLSKEAASIIISNWLTLFTLHYITPMYDIWWLRQILVHFNNFKYFIGLYRKCQVKVDSHF